MFFSSRLSTAGLIELCRSLRYSLSGGLMLRDAMDLLATQGVPRLRPLAARVSKSLKSGWSLQEALDRERDAFPPLFLALIAVGEETGNLPEMLHELEQYYRLQQKLRREFISEITWPAIQLTVAILVISGLIYVLGIIAISRGKDAQVIDPLGIGLVGTSGALIFLFGSFGSILLFFILLRLSQRLFRRRAVVERMLLRVPVVGPCLRALSMVRFCIALRLMLDTSLSILQTLRLALVATDNAAFVSTAPRVDSSLRRGESIAQSLRDANVFAPAFLGTLAVAEESGRLPEVLLSQGEDFDGEARRRLAILNKIASYGVWMFVGALLITAIFRIFTIAYLSNIEKYLPR
jgi:type IV pilus assembly protein PilC